METPAKKTALPLIAAALTYFLLAPIWTAGLDLSAKSMADEISPLPIRIAAVSSQFGPSTQGPWTGAQLIDGQIKENGWASATGAAFPHVIILELQQPGPVNALGLNPFTFDEVLGDNTCRTWPRSFQIHVSSEGLAEQDFFFAGVFELSMEGSWQTFRFEERYARYVRLTILSNWGNERWTELNEIRLFHDRRDRS